MIIINENEAIKKLREMEEICDNQYMRCIM